MYRILIVEDEQTIARAVAEELSHWGLESHCVENFRDVMVDFQAFQPQLVLQTASADRFTTQADYFSAWAHQIKTPIAAMGLKLQNEDSPLPRERGQPSF